MTIRTVTVIGASGSMGADVGGIFASFGAAKVYMVSRSKSEKPLLRAIKSVRSDSIREKLVIADFSELEECVAQSELVFESVAEDMELKKQINLLVANSLKDEALYVTGTSGLSLDEMASELPEKMRHRYFGMHMFNPPYNMTLCELIKTRYVDDSVILDSKRYLEEQLHRDVVIVKDSPAFLANRIGFYFINRALQYAERYKNRGGIDYIEAVLGPFTGRMLMPCATADFVGLDVHKAIVDNVYKNTDDYAHDFFRCPDYVDELIKDGRLGRKTGEGLFKQAVYDDNTKRVLVYDISAKIYREKRQYYYDFAIGMNRYIQDGEYDKAFDVLRKDQSEEGKICRDFLKDYIEYALFVAGEICEDQSYADIAMAEGFNWCPPMAMSNAIFGTKYETEYDYRKFFRARR